MISRPCASDQKTPVDASSSATASAGLGHESCEQELAVCANWLAKVLAADDDDDVLGAAAGVNFVK